MRRARAFTLVEVLLASALLLYVSFAFLTIYHASVREAVHSQMLVLANFTGDSLLEEAVAHQYGRQAPASWGLQGRGLEGEWQTVEYDVIIDGRPVRSVFHVKWHLQNGSFVGRSIEKTDLVSIVISWQEGEGMDPDYGRFRNTYFEGDNRHLVVQVPVWE